MIFFSFGLFVLFVSGLVCEAFAECVALEDAWDEDGEGHEGGRDRVHDDGLVGQLAVEVGDGVEEHLVLVLAVVVLVGFLDGAENAQEKIESPKDLSKEDWP